jgi:uncharacterized caspase-like protein
VQSFGRNYLLPVDAALQDAADLDLVALEADAVLRQMASARNRTNIVILDACRDNPFETVRSLEDNGLAEMNAPRGTFLSYATGPGAVALDGIGAHSPFSEALATAIEVPDQPIEQVFKAVRVSVIEKTRGLQTPWDTSSLTTNFVFHEGARLTAEQAEEQRLWEAVEQSRDAVQIMLFLRSFPNGPYAQDARALLQVVMDEELDTTSTALAAAEPLTRAPAPPQEDEKTLFETARASEKAADYEAYLSAFPNGTFAEIARAEIKRLAPQAEAQSAALQIAPGAQVQLRFSEPMTQGTVAIVGRTIEEAASGAPLFPPIEGLPDELWKGQDCANCHQWTQTSLCDQANTYLTEAGAASLEKQHPYGGSYKRNLKHWAEGGCL